MMSNKLVIFFSVLAVIVGLAVAQIEDGLFPVTILHLNDMHAR